MIGVGLSPAQVAVRRPARILGPADFVLNGSTNAALRALLSTNTGRVIVVGDSIPAGEGTGSAGPGSFGLGNASQTRIGKFMADALAAAAHSAIDKNYLTGDFGVSAATGNTLLTYEPRVTSLGDGSFNTRDPSAAGAGFFHLGSTAVLSITDTGVDAFVVDVAQYAASTIVWNIDGSTAGLVVTINGVAQPVGTASFAAVSGGGFARIVIKSPNGVGSRNLQMAASNGNSAVSCIHGINTTLNQISVLSFTACGQCGSEQADPANIYLPAALTNELGGGGLALWSSGTNDMIQGTLNGNIAARKSSWLSAMSTFVSTVQSAGGTPLLAFPHAFSNVPDATTADWNLALKAYGAANGIATISDYDAYGPNSGLDAYIYHPASPRDDHPTSAFSKLLANRRVQAMLAMAA